MTRQEKYTLIELLEKLFEEERAKVIEENFGGDEDEFEEAYSDDPFDVGDDGYLMSIDAVLSELK